MTGLPPTVGSDRLFEAAGAPISALRGRLVEPELEGAFRLQAWPEWSSRVRVVALLTAAIYLAFGYTDWLLLGPGMAVTLCWASRLAVLAGALVLARVTLGAPAPARLDAAVLVQCALFAASLFVVVAIQQHQWLLKAPGAMVMVLAFWLFVPARLEVQAAGALLVSAGFLLLAPAQASAAELLTVALNMALCNVLGGFTASRVHGAQRGQFLARRDAERAVRFEKLVARLSTRFITLPGEALNAAIDEALGEIGEHTGMDRVYVFGCDAAREELECLHEWCAPGVAKTREQFRRVPYATFSWGIERILAGEPVWINDVDEAPEAAAPEREAMRGLGVRSILFLPLVHGEEVLGTIGLHSRRPMPWSDERVAVLRIVGDLLSGVMMHLRTTRALDRQTHTLEASVAALERSNADLQQFAYVASHDLQEPLRAVASFSALLATRYEGKIGPDADEYIRYLTTAARRMNQMITDLLEYSRLDARVRPFAPVDCNEVVASALANLRVAVDSSGAQVTIDPLPTVEGDPGQLLQLFQNLIGNALKFHAGRAPDVRVQAERRGAFWVVSVADNGIGIEPRHKERVFQIFSRLHTPEQYPGTGIGLAVCRRIVERHFGRIWVEPNTPCGSVFRLTLPAVE